MTVRTYLERKPRERNFRGVDRFNRHRRSELAENLVGDGRKSGQGRQVLGDGVRLGKLLGLEDVPEDPVLRGGGVGVVVGDGVPPRRRPAVSAEELAAPALQLQLKPVAYRLPLVLPVRRDVVWVHVPLDDLAPRHPQQERHVRRRQVVAVAALQPYRLALVLHALNRPPGLQRRAVAALPDGLVVVVGD